MAHIKTIYINKKPVLPKIFSHQDSFTVTNIKIDHKTVKKIEQYNVKWK